MAQAWNNDIHRVTKNDINDSVDINERHQEILLGLINKCHNASPQTSCHVYVESLFNVRVDGGGSLNDDEIVALCTKFNFVVSDTMTSSM